MKINKKLVTIACALTGLITQAQNIFPAIGNVGIGTTTPNEKLTIEGGISAQSSTNVGGYLTLVNKSKLENNIANYWRIYNMSEGYGNSLQFWAYDTRGCVPGGLCNNRFTLMDNGNVGIGTTTPTAKLTVEGKILASSIRVAVPGSTNWSDYVFTPEYKLQPLEQVEAFIKENKHLPNIPSAAQMVKEGNDLGETDAKLLEKIEELTLYMIQQNKRIEEMQKGNQEIKKQNETLEKEVIRLKTLIN